MHGASGMAPPRFNLGQQRRSKAQHSGAGAISLLPLPASVRAALHRRSGSRLPFLLGGILVTLLLYALWYEAPAEYIPAIYNRTVPGRKHDADFENNHIEISPQIPEQVAEQFDLKGLPLRLQPHPNPRPDLPKSAVFTDPWPTAPKIANSWLSEGRLAGLSWLYPSWPTTEDERHSNGRTLPAKIPWKDLFRPEGYRGPVALEPVTDEQARQPSVQAKTFMESEDDIKIRLARQDWVKRAFMHAWSGYRGKAWGYDEVKPISGKGHNAFNAWGATIVDSLSTLLVMNLTEEYSRARTHVRQIDFSIVLGERSVYSQIANSRTVPTFETIIRYLGGLVSAYDLSGGDLLMLERAEELAEWLMGAFDTRFGLPLGAYQLGTKPDGRFAGRVALAEAGSFALEFGRLAQITGKSEYYDIVHRATAQLAHGWKQARRRGSLLPTHVDDSKPDKLEDNYSLGALTDSYYEYLLKASMLFRNATAAEQYGEMYKEAIDSAYSEGLVQKVGVIPEHEDLMLIGQLKFDTYMPIWEHLACYAGGMLGMGSKLFSRSRDFETGEEFTKTCVWAYEATWTGIGPEVLHFFLPTDPRRFTRDKDDAGQPFLKLVGTPPGVERGDKKGQGRPESIESVFYMWRLTGDLVWQERGWRMFTAWVQHSIAPFGFAGLNNVNSGRYRQTDSMESFVLAETLKYYYLLFSDPNYLSLDEYVFNTEGHPLQLPLSSEQSVPSSFNPSWKLSKVDEEAHVQYADLREPLDVPPGSGTWVQKQLRRLEFAHNER